MTRRGIITVALALAALVGCGILSPSTELEVQNRTGAGLSLTAWKIPNWSEVPRFSTEPLIREELADGESRSWDVEPGRWFIEALTEDMRYGSVVVDIPDGTRHVVPFTPEDTS